MCRSDTMVKRSSRAFPCVIALIEISGEAVQAALRCSRISKSLSWRKRVWVRRHE
jgi:hypothetical protein